MTNAEKFLKDGVDLCELIRNIADYRPKLETSDNVYAKMQEFFKEQATPALTKHERVILRNVNEEYTTITRNENGQIYLGIDYFGMYDHLFQFIKERRRI